MSIRVLLVDDNPTLRVGLQALLKPDTSIQVVGEAASGADALSKATSLHPDVVLLDSALPDMSGSEVAEEIQRLGLPTTILCFSGFADENHVFGMLDAGAIGYVLKTEAPQTVVAAIKNAAAGNGFLSPSISGMVLRRMQTMRSKIFSLTEREREILYKISRGQTNDQISRVLGISKATVKNHLTSIYSKLGVGSRSESIVWAWENGIVSRARYEGPKWVVQNS